MNNSRKDRRDCLPESLREAYEAGFAAGMDAEHRRILSVHAAALDGHVVQCKLRHLDNRMDSAIPNNSNIPLIV